MATCVSSTLNAPISTNGNEGHGHKAKRRGSEDEESRKMKMKAEREEISLFVEDCSDRGFNERLDKKNGDKGSPLPTRLYSYYPG